MIRAVLDANTIVSGMARFRTGTGAPAVILRAWVSGEFELLISDHILDEARRTLSKPYFRQHVSPDVCRDTLEAFVDQAAFISVTDVISGVATHPEDDRVLSAVASASADYLVTGDRQLQRIEVFRGSRIVTPNMFRSILEE